MNQQPTKTIYPSGMVTWTLNGAYHRENGPAIEHVNGYRAWYLHDKFLKSVGGLW